MTEKAFYKHAENVLGLDEKEASELWEEYQQDRSVERDNNGFRGAERLWIPAHELKSKDREHYSDSRAVEGSDNIRAPPMEDRRMLQENFGGRGVD